MKPSTRALCSLTLLLLAPRAALAEEQYKSVGITIYPAGSPEAQRQTEEMKPPPAAQKVVQAEETPNPTPAPQIPDGCPACGMG